MWPHSYLLWIKVQFYCRKLHCKHLIFSQQQFEVAASCLHQMCIITRPFWQAIISTKHQGQQASCFFIYPWKLLWKEIGMESFLTFLPQKACFSNQIEIFRAKLIKYNLHKFHSWVFQTGICPQDHTGRVPYPWATSFWSAYFQCMSFLWGQTLKRQIWAFLSKISKQAFLGFLNHF